MGFLRPHVCSLTLWEKCDQTSRRHWTRKHSNFTVTTEQLIAEQLLAAVFILEVCTGHCNFCINTESFFPLQESITTNPQKPMQFHITADVFSALSLFPSASRLNEESKLQYQWTQLSGWNAKRAVEKSLHPQFLHCCAIVVKNGGVCLAINISSKTGHLQTQQWTIWEFCRQPDTVFSVTCYQPYKLVYDRDRFRDTFPF